MKKFFSYMICITLVLAMTLSLCACSNKCDHNFGEWQNTKTPTCTSIGYKTRSCNECDYVEYDFIDQTGHNFGEWQTDQQSSCTSVGIKTKKCSVCNMTEYQTMAQGSHNYQTTKTTNEYIQKTCTVCGDTTTEFLTTLEEQIIGKWAFTQSVVETWNTQNDYYKEISSLEELGFQYSITTINKNHTMSETYSFSNEEITVNGMWIMDDNILHFIFDDAYSFILFPIELRSEKAWIAEITDDKLTISATTQYYESTDGNFYEKANKVKQSMIFERITE